MQSQQPVIRTYRGRERRQAEEAYRQDAAQAALADWHPVGHRWTSSIAGEELSVVFEHRGGVAPVVLVTGPAPDDSGRQPASYAEAESAAYREAEPVEAIAVAAAIAATDEPGTADEPQPALSDEPIPADPWEDAISGLGTTDAGAEPPTVDAATDAEPEASADAAPPVEPEAAEVLEPAEVPEPAVEPEPIAAIAAVAAPVVVQAAAAVPSAPVQVSSRPVVRAHARAVVQSIDLHTAGEPLRLIRSGFPAVPALPILERRRWLKENADYARRVLMWEPRGHRDMYGAILLPPHRDDADIAVLFMHNEGYSTMCGHGVIAIATGLIEEGLYPAAPPQTVIRFETPAGVVTAVANVARTDDGRNEVSSVRFQNVPSYLHASGLRVRPDGVALHGAAADAGELSVDMAFGGAYYGVVDAADLGLRVVPEQGDALTRAGAAITEVLRRDHSPTHPTDADLGFVYGTIIVDHDPATAPDGRAENADIRNVTIFAEGEVDRSPCGSGTSALLAQMHALGKLEMGRDITNAGITGEAFRGRVEAETSLGEHRAVVTTVEGSAYITGYHTFVVDDRDPLGNGFLIR